MSKPNKDELDLESLDNDEFFKDLDTLIGNLDTPGAKNKPTTQSKPSSDDRPAKSTVLTDEDALNDLEAFVTADESVSEPRTASSSASEIPLLNDVVFKSGSIPGEAVSMLSALKTVKNTENPITAADIERMVEEILDRHLEQVREDLKQTILSQLDDRVLSRLPKGGDADDS